MIESKQLFSRTVEVPEFIENDNQEVVYWGKDNLLPQWLNYLYITCAVHQGIINGKVNYILGDGLKGNDELVKMFDPILKYIATDIEISNSAYVKVWFKPDGKTIGRVQHIPFEWVRVTKSGIYQVSEDWSQSRFKITDYVSINDRADEMVCIIPFKEHGRQFKIDPNKRKLSLNYYPVVPYAACVKSILTDIEIKNYEFSETVNNFSLGTIVSLNNGASPNDEDRQNVKDYIIDNATGSDNSGGVMVLFNNGKDTEPTVMHLNGNQLNERYLSLGEKVQDNILKGHSAISGELFGFTKDGNFNQANIDIAYSLFKNTYVKMRQNQLLSIIYAVAEINGIAESVEFIEFELPKTEVVAPRFKMSNENVQENELIEAFANCGIERTGNEDIILFGNYDADLFKQHFVELDVVTQRVLQLISQETPFDAVMEATETKASDLARIYKKLTNLNLVDIDGSITQSGKIQVARQDIARIQTVYSYEVKPNYGADVIDGTRDFCRKMVELSKTRFWTIEQINEISTRFEMDVWRYRGGWYHNPNTEKNEPSCRHYFKQNVIFK